MNPHDVLNWLQQQGMHGNHIHSSYRLVRKKPDGTDQELTVTIYDNTGIPVGPNYRYSAVALSDDGKGATGNAASSIDLALDLMRLHLSNLD